MDLDVAAIHQGYLKGFRTRGGAVVTDAEVSAIGTDGAPWRVETRAGSVEAAVLVDMPPAPEPISWRRWPASRPWVWCRSAAPRSCSSRRPRPTRRGRR
jgi:hypothetical protein